LADGSRRHALRPSATHGGQPAGYPPPEDKTDRALNVRDAVRGRAVLEAAAMIITVTLNSAVDVAATLSRLEVGAVNRSHTVEMFPGGKGVNVAKAVAALGGDVLATGFVGCGPVGGLLQQALTEAGVRHHFIGLPGDTRLTFLLYDETGHTETIVNNPAGYRVSPEGFQALRDRLSGLAGPRDLVVLSGSVAEGCRPDAYAELIRALADAGAKAVLDTSGEALARGVEARPFMVKPTARELADLIGWRPQTDHEVLAAAREISARGVEAVVVSLGARGAIAVRAGDAYAVRPPAATVISAIGAGDAMVGGMVVALSRGETFAEALRLGTAAAVSSLRRHGAGMCIKAEADRLTADVSVELLR
jgi:1-phosphofructokinase family hexose kinase